MDASTLPPPPRPTREWALFLDVDGTLTDLAPTPDDVQVPADLVDDLFQLYEVLDGALVLVSGRLIESLDRMFAPLQLPAIGLHGLQWRDGDIDERDAPQRLPAVLAAAQALARKYPGALVEPKGISIALHWRNAPAAEEPLHEFASSALIELPGYRLQAGHDVIELRPDGHDKGDAITAMLATPGFVARTPAFLGDDLTDEPGFDAINARHGVTILVGGRSPSSANYGLRDPAAVRAWLHEAATTLRQEAAS